MIMGTSFEEYYFTIAIMFGTTILMLLYHRFVKRPDKFPPGPTGLPLVGYLPFLGDNPAETITKMKSEYGSVVSLQMGRENWIFLNDYDTINEAFVKQGEIFSGRPKNAMFHILSGGYGLANADYGDKMKTLRKFGLKTLRGFGIGKKSMEANVIEESTFLIENLMKKSNTILRRKFTLAVSNIISRITFGSRFTYDDKEYISMLDLMRELYFSDSYITKMFRVMMYAPILRHFPPFRGVFQTILIKNKVYMDILRKIVKEHDATFNENDIRDFIDAFISEIKAEGQNDPTFSIKHLVQFIRDLFEAGSTTTSSTLGWAILCFAHYPERQEKIAKEIESIIGDSGVPQMKHRQEMPYTCAFIHELSRHRTLGPLGIFHKTNKNAALKGYAIPKDITVLANFWAVHNDPNLFEKPAEFRPERFLDNDGKFVKSNYVIPFSVGPRHCLGEQLATMEIFIFLTSIVQKLKIVRDPLKKLPPFDKGVYAAITYEPPEFEVIFEKR